MVKTPSSNGTKNVEYENGESLATETVKEPKAEPISTQPKYHSTPPISLKANTKIAFSESISIKKTVESVQNGLDQSADNYTPKPTQPFTETDFEKKWNEYKHQLLQAGKSSLASIFEVIPEINNEEINITLENKALDDEFNAHKSEVLDFLRLELHNYNISITTKINKDIKTKKAYTPHEKFAKMSEKNPHLMTLAKTFNADIGYPID